MNNITYDKNNYLEWQNEICETYSAEELVKINLFARKWRNKFFERHPDVGDKTFAEDAYNFGFNSDQYDIFSLYPGINTEKTENLRAVINDVIKPDIIGRAIVAHWYQLTYWLKEGGEIYKEEARDWFLLAFDKLIELTAHGAAINNIIEYGKKRLKKAAAGEDFFQQVPAELPQGDLTAWYLRNFGRIINTDCAKMAFIKDGYCPGAPASVAKYHPDSSEIVKALIGKMLAEISAGDTVFFMAGGNGSGKSTFCDGMRPYLDNKWVIDATLASLDAARNTMKKVFAYGAKAVIIHIIRTPEDAWHNGVLKRAAHGSHCTPRTVFDFSHQVVADNVSTLEDEFASEGVLVSRVENL